MKDKKQLLKNIALTIAVVSVAVIWRIVNNRFMIAPNLELVTSMAVLVAISVNYRFAIITALGSMMISDLIIGNTSIFVFTWSSFILIAISAGLLKKLNQKPIKQVVTSFGFAIASSFMFFVITNFGVWLEGWYTMDMAGLLKCFTLAIPFYRTMLIGNIILAPTIVGLRQVLIAYQKSKLSVINSSIR